MRKVKIEELKGLNYEEGEKLLLECGYVQNDTGMTEETQSCDYILDTYFTLYDDEDNESHIVSFSQYMNKNNDPSNDDGSDDIVVKELWGEV